MSTVRNPVAVAGGGENSAGAGGAAECTGTLNRTCPSSLPSTAHKMGRWPSSSPGKGVSHCTVSLAFQAGPTSSPLSPNWNLLSRLLRGQAPMTSVRKGALAFPGWPHCSAAVSGASSPFAGRGRDRIRIRLLTTVFQATWISEGVVWKKAHRPGGQRTVEVFIVSGQKQKQKNETQQQQRTFDLGAQLAYMAFVSPCSEDP